jgi:hypothetical protein
MNAAQIRMVGISAWVYLAMIVVTIIAGVVFVAQAVSSGKAGTPMAMSIVSLIAGLVYAWMLWNVADFLETHRKIGGAKMIAMVLIALIVVDVVLSFTGVGAASFSLTGVGILGIVMLVSTIVKGVLMILLGVKALGAGTGIMKAFGVLLIIAGACTAVIVLIFLQPFLMIAAAIVLGIAMMGEAKKATA